MIVGRWHTDRFGRIVGEDDGAPLVRDGRSPCIVAFHGFTGTTSEIRPMLDVLSDRGFAVHAPLLPGHGSHPRELQDATFDAWVDAMRTEVLLASARHERIVLCGFSLGSLVAIELAAGRPSGLAGLVLLGNAITLSPVLDRSLGFLHRRGVRIPDWYFLKLWASDVADPVQKRRVAAYDRDPIRAALEVYRGGQRATSRLGTIACPTLILHGEKDRVCPKTNAERVATMLGTRDVTVKLYPRSAHLVATDFDRADVADEVARFVERIA